MSELIAEQQGAVRAGAGGLAHGEHGGAAREDLAVHLLEEVVQAGAAREALVADAEGRARGPAVGQALLLRDHVDRVHAEAVDPQVEPPVHHVVDGPAHPGVLPVEVRLPGGEQVEVVLA